jgi:D-beta-D-heptose 7-phosphate kinase / D-beta-D-heptose 1-phosphate adenosyltransferase
MRLTVVGDVLLDRDLHGDSHRLCPDAPAPVVDHRSCRSRPGGAGLAALVAAHLGATVTLVGALGDDDTSLEVRRLLEAAGIDVVALPTSGETGEKVRVRSGEHTLVRIDRGRPGPLHIDAAAFGAMTQAVESADAVVVADYARGVTTHRRVRETLAETAAYRPTVWDPHPRGAEPVPGAWLLTPNEHELSGTGVGGSPAATAAAARRLQEAHRARAVAVTLGARGALLVAGDGPPLVCPCDAPAEGDTSGAGDAFAIGAALALGRGAVHSEAVATGVAAGATFVADLRHRTWFDERGVPVVGPPAAADGRVDPSGRERGGRAGGDADADRRVSDLIARTRAAGGTVVMTGGCFDLLHRGHVQLLRHARSLGDCLVICLNSDASVRRLKGPQRPIVPAADRAGVLAALAAVDDVVVFDEDTPVDVLRRHHPDVFVKGGDYRGTELPEAAAMAEWGGDVVIVPYVDGHSTTRLLQEVLHAH